MVKKRKLGIKIVTVVLGAILLLTLFGGCAAEAEEKTVVFGEGDWDSINIYNGIVAFILENGYDGYKVDYVYGSEQPMAIGVIGGDIDVIIETWMMNNEAIMYPALDEGTITDVGSLFAENWQGWCVPRYVVEGDAERGIEPMAPGLKSISDLPEYWEIFKDPEEPTKGRIYNGVPGWSLCEWNDIKLVSEGLEDYYVMFSPGSGYALSASLEGAYRKGEPWLGYYWEPSWEMGVCDMYKLEDEPYDEEVWLTDYSCGYPVTPVDIVVNSEFAEREPEVIEFLRNIESTCDLTNTLLAYLMENELDTHEVSMWFLQEYESVWSEWVSSDVASKVRAALP